ncbi:MAG TPA: hypothetical protein VFS67_18495 [Polyangiaceae bacterium]|nr:hypothetical protein [Polyangiaceae bacterium]
MEFAPPTAPPWLISAFVFLPMLVVLTALIGVSVALRRSGGSRLLQWLVALLLVGAMGASLDLALDQGLAKFDSAVAPFLPLTAGCIALWVIIAASRVGRAVAALPVAALIAFHVFRLPLELMMHAAASAGVMPHQMSYSGWNFDIVTGVTALLVAPLAAFGGVTRSALLAWNALGSVLLLVIVLVAIASSPPWLAFGAERANTWVAYAPFVWLPTVLVPAAAAGHVVLWRRLLQHQDDAVPAPPAQAS